MVAGMKRFGAAISLCLTLGLAAVASLALLLTLPGPPGVRDADGSGLQQHPERSVGQRQRPARSVVLRDLPAGPGAKLVERERANALTVCPAGPPTCDYATIQSAVDAAHDGDVIKVAAATYTDLHARPVPPGYSSPPASGIITQVLFIDKSLTIRGGYSTAFVEPPDLQARPATLDAQKEGRALFIAGDINPTIEGLHLTGGTASGLGGGGLLLNDAGGGVYVISATATFRGNRVFSNTAVLGGGLFLKNSAAILSGNTVSSNHAFAIGGGLYLHVSDAALVGNIVTANSAGGLGGGLYLVLSDAALSGNDVSGNDAVGPGGGLYLFLSDASLRSNIVVANSAGSGGGGLYLSSSDASLSGNTISANGTSRQGGGLYLDRSDVTLTNNVIADNLANGAGGGLYSYCSSPRLLYTTIARNAGGDGSGVCVAGSNSTLVVTNSILVSHKVGITVRAGNTVTLEATLWGTDTWSNDTDWVGGGTIITGTINLWSGPDFVDAGNGDYHIGPDSGALDAGVDTGVATDIDHEPRPYQTPDLGADEYWPPGTLNRFYLPLVLRQSP